MLAHLFYFVKGLLPVISTIFSSQAVELEAENKIIHYSTRTHFYYDFWVWLDDF